MSADYWETCISEAFEDAGIDATTEQIGTVISWVEGCHENYSMANGHDAIPSPLDAEVKRLKAEIVKNQEKHESQLRGVRESVARRRNINVSSIHISDSGSVTYEN